MASKPGPGRAVGKTPDDALARRIAGMDWAGVARELDERGHAVLPGVLTARECRELARVYPDDDRFRKRIVMQHRAYGQGEYSYFACPLPPVVQCLREHLYLRLAPIARAWSRRLGETGRLPKTLGGYLRACRRAGQTRPTPLLLRYETGDYNRLHQDVYGAMAFPLQVTVLLSRPGVDFTGGEFLLTEQRPRVQSRGEVVPLAQGQGVVFANRLRPVEGARGAYRVQMRHGVSRLLSGLRFALGIIFHDAE